MIRYALECAGCGERFEAWFKNAESCDAQLACGAVACPVCAGVDVSKGLMAPAVAKKSEENAASAEENAASAREENAAAAREEAVAPTGDDRARQAPSLSSAPSSARRGASGAFAAHARAIEEKLRALRAHVEATAEPVGENFAKEARAIHEGEADERAIYGQASREEAEELLEDGIAVAPIPWIDRRDD